MDCCILRKVKYRLPGNRLVWGVILMEREGLSLLFVAKPGGHHSHLITIAAENVAEHCFEDAKTNRFLIHHADLTEIGSKLRALGDSFSTAAFKKFFEPDEDGDDWKF